jgi:hypothetical protein
VQGLHPVVNNVHAARAQLAALDALGPRLHKSPRAGRGLGRRGEVVLSDGGMSRMQDRPRERRAPLPVTGRPY